MTIRITARWAVAAASSACAGCSSNGDDSTPPMPMPMPTCTSAPLRTPMCDGSDGLVLRIFIAGSPREGSSSVVRTENGYPSFAVDGQCRYFMGGGWSNERRARDFGWRQGVLTEEVQHALECEVGMDDLSSVYSCASGSVFDAPAQVVANTRSLVGCEGGAGMDLLAVFTRMRERASELWNAAQPLDGDLHIAIAPEGGFPESKTYPWPSELDIRDYLPSEADMLEPRRPGQSKLVPAMYAAPFRALRDQSLRDSAGSDLPVAGVRLDDPVVAGTLYMRDALPYEDERGLWPLPGH